jgi:hypothetical protein
MNKRIKQLQFQAAAQIGPLLVGAEWQREFTKKFAELMVIEFSDVVKQTANEITTAGFKGDGTHDEVMLCVNGALSVLDNIRKRFGGE